MPRPASRTAPRLLLAATLAAAPAAVAPDAALAQPGAGTRQATPEPPFAGEVSSDSVEVRSGAGESYYPVAEFEAGQRVRVVEDFYGWYRIEAPAGLRAYVAQADLDRRGDGSVGVANGDGTRVRIKGMDRGYDESFRTITTLDRGDRVEIVGKVGDEAYEVLAPAGSLVFLPPGSVRPLAQLGGGAAEPATPRPVTTPPAGEMVPLSDAAAEPAPPAPPAQQDPPAQAAPPEPAAPQDAPVTLPPLDLGDGDGGDEGAGPGADPTLAAAETPAAPSEGVAAVEEARLPQFALPLEEQPLEEMEAAYADLLTDEALRPFERRLVESRLRAVERNRQLKAAVAQIQQRRDGLVDVEPTAVEPEPAAPYAAVGVLRTSSVFAGEEGGVALPKMYRVVDPASGRTIAYLRPASGVDPVPLLGQLVGVRGTREIDPTLGTPLVTAQSIDALNASR